MSARILRMDRRDRLIVALDYGSREAVLRAADSLRGAAGSFKVGLQAFSSAGPDLVSELVKRGDKVFLDLKLHDIPNTVEHATAAAARLGVSMLTVHASGGVRMMEAAAAAAQGSGTAVLGVTVLTSLEAAELRAIGFADEDPHANVIRLARLAQQAGLAGVIASPLEIRDIRRECGAGFLIVTPGIRSSGDAAGDQKRTMSAAEAVRAGADYIVVGRPITAAGDPRAAALRIVEEIG